MCYCIKMVCFAIRIVVIVLLSQKHSHNFHVKNCSVLLDDKLNLMYLTLMRKTRLSFFKAIGNNNYILQFICMSLFEENKNCITSSCRFTMAVSKRSRISIKKKYREKNCFMTRKVRKRS